MSNNNAVNKCNIYDHQQRHQRTGDDGSTTNQWEEICRRIVHQILMHSTMVWAVALIGSFSVHQFLRKSCYEITIQLPPGTRKTGVGRRYDLPIKCQTRRDSHATTVE